jgi:hypothetical protein
MQAAFYLETSHAVQVAFFVDDDNPGLSLEGEFTHVAISYRGRWLHAHPSTVNGRLSKFPGVHLTQNLIEIGLNFVVFENLDVEDPSEDFYNKFKDRSFDILADWNSKTETHCSILVGKHLGVKPAKMKFKSAFWRNVDVSSVKGKLGVSPKEIFEHVKRDLGFSLFYKSHYSTFKGSLRNMKCSMII